MTFILGHTLKTFLYSTETSARIVSESLESETPPCTGHSTDHRALRAQRTQTDTETLSGGTAVYCVAALCSAQTQTLCPVFTLFLRVSSELTDLFEIKSFLVSLYMNIENTAPWCNE